MLNPSLYIPVVDVMFDTNFVIIFVELHVNERLIKFKDADIFIVSFMFQPVLQIDWKETFLATKAIFPGG